MSTETLILGGGLSGLYAAHLLTQRAEEFLLLEAREHLGGRILSEVDPSPNSTAGYDLGPSWFWPGFQPQVRQLVDELGLRAFPQDTAGLAIFEDEHHQLSRFPSHANEPRSFRIEGGIARLTERLAEQLDATNIRTSVRVRRLAAIEGGVRVTAEDSTGKPLTLETERVLLAAPPRLLARTLTFDPPLPPEAQQALLATPTWMAGHAKFVALYEEPIWRNQGLSGQAFSRRGPMAEIHDASPIEGGPFALFGFYGLSAMARRAAGRTLIEESISQLERLFGPKMLEPLRVLFKDWSDDPLTATSEDFTPLAGHPTYGLPEVLRELWDGRLHFCSTETSVRNGGYLEGALDAARRVVADFKIHE